ncbi:tRNA (adenosine(37)-N6)-threonylcarbamoyltransferase complex ATPase subunit type 1 TsaE [Pedobacter sp. PWIIR3]
MTLEVNSLADITIAAKQLAAIVKENKICLFYGDMGAGKTTLIKSICAALSVQETVSSPTFSIVNEYHAGDQVIYHFDFYRIKSIQEAFDIGYEDYFYSGNICLVEWPEKIQELIPEERVDIEIGIIDQDKRKLNIKIYN